MLNLLRLLCSAELPIDRNLTIRGANGTAGSPGARPIRFNMGFLYQGLKVAPHVTLTLQDLELRDFSYVPRPAKDFMSPTQNATLKWHRIWQHWRVFPRYEVHLEAERSAKASDDFCLTLARLTTAPAVRHHAWASKSSEKCLRKQQFWWIDLERGQKKGSKHGTKHCDSKLDRTAMKITNVSNRLSWSASLNHWKACAFVRYHFF
jgi:hypothetical protein